jgi:SAM-dependent methyltransferase
MPDSRAEWDERVRMYGPRRAVLNVKNSSPEREAAFISAQEAAVVPLLRGMLRREDRFVVDFGCGTGRWSGRLARMVIGRCLAIDPTPAILAEAKPDPRVDYRIMGRAIPLASGIADVVFACLVMNAIVADEDVVRAVSEIGRVLRPGGLLFLVDVTLRSNERTRWSVLRSEWGYAEMFKDVAPLRAVGSYLDLGELHSIMAGRKP